MNSDIKKYLVSLIIKQVNTNEIKKNNNIEVQNKEIDDNE